MSRRSVVALVVAAGVAVEAAEDLAGPRLGTDRVRQHRRDGGALAGAHINAVLVAAEPPLP